MVKWILDKPRCALWAPMGSGKTAATLTAIDLLILTGDVKRVLILAPLRVATSVWPVEVGEWAHLRDLRVSKILGTPKQRGDACYPIADADIYVSNYENIEWLVAVYDMAGVPWPYDMIVCDESVKLKSFRTRQGGKRARALSTVAYKAKRWLNLTGLPAPSGVIDLWGQSWYQDRGARLGLSFRAFSERWFSQGFSPPGVPPPLIPLAHALDEVKGILSDINLAVQLDFKVDKPIETDLYVDLPPAAMKQYKDMEKKMYAELDAGTVTAFNAGSAAMKCRQIAAGALYVDEKNSAFETIHDAKIEMLRSIIDEAAGMPVLCFYHFRHDLSRLQKAYPTARLLSTDKDVADFNAGNVALLVCSPASAGHGVNLQHGTNIAVFFSPDYSYDTRAQAIERVGPLRQLQAGFKRPVFVYNILARSTVDTLVITAAREKRAINELLMEARNASAGNATSLRAMPKAA